jgi:putative tRNA adenosine deaminase-associated protein
LVTSAHFAAAVVRGKPGWSAQELDLSVIADVDEVADLLRDVEPEASVSLLFVEADDTYLVIMRLDDGEDLRVFGSDSAFAEESRLGKLLLSDVESPALEIDEDVDADADEDKPAPIPRPIPWATPTCWPISASPRTSCCSCAPPTASCPPTSRPSCAR